MTHPRFPPPPRRLPAPAPPPRRCWSSPGSSCPTRLRFDRRTYVLPSFRFLSLPPLPRCWLRPRSLKPLTTAGIVVPAPSPLLPSSPSLSLSLSLLLSLLTTCRLRLCLHCRLLPPPLAVCSPCRRPSAARRLRPLACFAAAARARARPVAASIDLVCAENIRKGGIRNKRIHGFASGFADSTDSHGFPR